MNVVWLRTMTLAALVVAASVGSAWAEDQTVDQQIDQLLGDHAQYQAVFAALQKAVAGHEAATVANLIDYPINVSVGGKRRTIKSARDFVNQYNAIMSPSIAKVVVDQKYEDLFVNYRGVMFGRGQVWLNGICRDKACKAFDVKVTAIQNGPK
jgi:hypothetical protein